MSWHRGDWLSFAQAAATMLAIVAAYGVVFLQSRLDKLRNQHRLDSVRAAIVEVATKCRELTYEAYDPMDVFHQVGTWEQYRAFRSRQFLEYREIVGTLSTQDIADLKLLDVAMKLRVNLRDMETIIAESNFHSAEGWINSRRMITHCKNNFDAISGALASP
ncbi:TPA: hypothetical protein SAY52_003946 [Burkholderia cenocepacia]|uniref:hypothetical protein n=1 Tax=unclassified Burkholderia TaxID=2613784 RepID=UPI00158AAE0E|nr:MULTISPECIES: hypothetical protein [unclassified Burkholderia]HEF5873297.1 hypothetical protein [Burkholderia cenocepacia]